MDMFDGFRLPMSLARSPLGTLADRSARGRRLNIRDILGVRFSALPTPPRKQPWRTLVASGFLTSVKNTLGAGAGSNHRKRWLLRWIVRAGMKALWGRKVSDLGFGKYLLNQEWICQKRGKI